MLGVSLACLRSKVAAAEATLEAGSTAEMVANANMGAWRKAFRASSQVHAELCQGHRRGEGALRSPLSGVRSLSFLVWRVPLAFGGGTTRGHDARDGDETGDPAVARRLTTHSTHECSQ